MNSVWITAILLNTGTKTTAPSRRKNAEKRIVEKIINLQGVISIPRNQKYCHLFYGIGDDEIQIDSFDKKLNTEVFNLAEKDPAAVFIINDEDKPSYLRAAVKTKNISFLLHKTPSAKTMKSLSENGKRHINNLRNQRKEVKP